MQDSLLNPHHRTFLVQHIVPNELDRVFKYYLNTLKTYVLIDVPTTRAQLFLIDSPRYYIFVLGLLAMQLGCSPSRKHRRWMKDNLHDCLFNEERVKQAKFALETYRDGQSLELGSMTLNQRIVTLAEGEGDWIELGEKTKASNPMLEEELAITRMELDNEVARAKGASETQGVNISGPLIEESGMAKLEEAVVAKVKGMVIPEGRIVMNPKGGLAHWLANKAARERWENVEHTQYGMWKRDQSRDEEMRLVFAQLLRNSILTR